MGCTAQSKAGDCWRSWRVALALNAWRFGAIRHLSPFPADMRRHAVALVALHSAVALTLTLTSPARLEAQAATFLGYTTRVPADWTSATPSSSMRLAEYRIAPPAGGTAGGTPVEVVVYFFGPGQGGDPQANIDRWQSQFSHPDGSPKITRETTGTFPMTIAEFRGSYARGIGTGSSAEAARPNHLLLAAIIETPKGTLFVQCFGPVPSTEAQRSAFMGFVRGLK
jgi:hypothetical protein